MEYLKKMAVEWEARRQVLSGDMETSAEKRKRLMDELSGLKEIVEAIDSEDELNKREKGFTGALQILFNEFPSGDDKICLEVMFEIFAEREIELIRRSYPEGAPDVTEKWTRGIENFLPLLHTKDERLSYLVRAYKELCAHMRTERYRSDDAFRWSVDIVRNKIDDYFKKRSADRMQSLIEERDEKAEAEALGEREVTIEEAVTILNITKREVQYRIRKKKPQFITDKGGKTGRAKTYLLKTLTLDDEELLRIVRLRKFA
jgi:hypothetical protein